MPTLWNNTVNNHNPRVKELPAAGIPWTLFGTPSTPVHMDFMHRYRLDEAGTLVPSPPTGPGPMGLPYVIGDRYHLASRTGKYPAHEDNQERPIESATRVPTLWPGLFGWLLRPRRVQLMTRANRVNPMGEFMGNTIYDGFMPAWNPMLAGQSENLVRKPLQNQTTRMAMGWQDAGITSGRGKPAGEIRNAP